MVDVAVVGAGIAGLVAATRLVDAGLSCVVLEREERVGGRLSSHQAAAGRLDLGATWFWPGETRVEALIVELGVATHAQHLAGDAMYHARGGVQRLDGNPIDVASGRFTHGAASLTEGLAARLGDIVSLDTAVHRIEHHDDAANDAANGASDPNADRDADRAGEGDAERAGPLRVTHDGGSLIARHVVLALPPSVAVTSIEFRPDLPDELVALASATPVWMGNIAKVVAVYHDAFWRRHGLSGSAISHVGPLREIHDMSGVDAEPAALFGFVPLGPADPRPSERAIIEQLVEIFGHDAASPLEIVVKDWRDAAPATSPGAPSRSPMETYSHRAYQRPTGGGRIHWASTETAPDSAGHIEGAIAAAQRAVAMITADPTGRWPSS